MLCRVAGVLDAATGASEDREGRGVAVALDAGRVDVLRLVVVVLAGGATPGLARVVPVARAGFLEVAVLLALDVAGVVMPPLPNCFVGDFTGVRLGAVRAPGVGLLMPTLIRLPTPSTTLCLLIPFTAACILLGLDFAGTPLLTDFADFGVGSSMIWRTPEGRRNMP